jgi:hypothetical protein
MKNDNVIKYDGFMWNWSNRAIYDDGIFITFFLNFALVDEIQWPKVVKKQWVLTL